MRRVRALLVGVVAIALPATEFGHLLAYWIEHGPSAWFVQSHGVHGYFPALLRTSVEVTAALALVALSVVAVGRAMARRRIGPTGGPWRDFAITMPVLFLLQVDLYLLQEALEAQANDQVLTLHHMLWGTLGQVLPAVLGALAVAWQAAKVERAIVAISRRKARAHVPPEPILVPAPAPIIVRADPRERTIGYSLVRRGPPRFYERI